MILPHKKIDMYIVYSTSGMLTFGYVTVNLTEYCRAEISILCGLMHVTLHILPFLRDRCSAIWGTFYIWLSMLLPFVQLNLLLIAGYSLSVFCCLLGYLKMAFSVFVTLTQKCQSLTGYNYKNSWDISIILSVLCLYLKALSNRAKTIAKHLDLNFSCHYLHEGSSSVKGLPVSNGLPSSHPVLQQSSVLQGSPAIQWQNTEHCLWITQKFA